LCRNKKNGCPQEKEKEFMKEKGHLIQAVEEGGIAEEMGIEPGDRLLEINGETVEDIFDYQYMIEEEYVEVLIAKPSGEEWLLEIDKDYEEDLGVTFDNGLMDDYRSCTNKCIFCFIDQMPKGMRETLYFKDDDSRLSFLQGNYVTLTNMSEKDVDRIIKYHLSPINISFQTTNPELRCRMLHNRFAGESLKKVDRFYEAGIQMNGQIVLCKGFNDGEELERSIRDLTKYLPHLQSVSVVPVGLSRFREGLEPLEPFTREDARRVLEQIHRWQEKLYPEYGLHFVHASDEWYILAGEELPREESYDGYLQLENGVGMIRLMLEEFEDALARLEEPEALDNRILKGTYSSVTGQIAYPYIRRMADRLMERFPEVKIQVFPIRNDFFGERITVTGLLTGQDIIAQLKGRDLGEILYLPENILRSGERVLLDDITVEDLAGALQVKTDIVKSSGYDFVDAFIRKL
jgi:putative radical SAM enzyme (TIGR03279 family)